MKGAKNPSTSLEHCYLCCFTLLQFADSYGSCCKGFNDPKPQQVGDKVGGEEGKRGVLQKPPQARELHMRVQGAKKHGALSAQT